MYCQYVRAHGAGVFYFMFPSNTNMQRFLFKLYIEVYIQRVKDLCIVVGTILKIVHMKMTTLFYHVTF